MATATKTIKATIELGQEHLALIKAAAEPPSGQFDHGGRPILETLYVDKDYVVAADGFMMFRTPVKTPRGFEPFAIPVELFKGIKLKAGETLTVQREGDELQVIRGTTVVTGKVTKGDYPNYTTFFSPSGKPKNRIAFDIENLKRALACMPKDATYVKFFFRTEDNSAGMAASLHTGISESTHGVIMPVLVGGGDVDWLEPGKKYRAPRVKKAESNGTSPDDANGADADATEEGEE